MLVHSISSHKAIQVARRIALPHDYKTIYMQVKD
jgi:hypothetical protein